MIFIAPDLPSGFATEDEAVLSLDDVSDDVSTLSISSSGREGSGREGLRLRAIIEAQGDIARAGLNLEKVLRIIAARMQEITAASGGVVELAEGDEMVYRAASGSAQNSLGLRLKQSTSLSGKCVLSGEILRCDDAETDARVDQEACRRVGARSMIVVPLQQGAQIAGVLKVLSPQPRAFGDEDVHTLQLMASLVSNVMLQAAEFAAKQSLLAQRTEALEALRESEERFRNSFDAAAIGKAIVGLDGRWMEVNHALCEMLGYSEHELFALTFQDITYLDDLTTDLEFLHETLAGARQNYQMEKRYFHKSGRIIWVLLCVSLVRDRDHQPLYFVSEIIDITGQKNALQLLLQSNDELQSLALYDSLTGIHNRRAFDERLQQEFEYSQSGGEAFSLVMFDIDHFKLHNDTFGHASGDKVLRAIGHLLRTELHPRDFSARYGGEEFALILPRTDHHGALRVAEKLRRALKEHSWHNGALTASFGVATAVASAVVHEGAEHNDELVAEAQTTNQARITALVEQADRALYAAKANGRNRVCCGEIADA